MRDKQGFAAFAAGRGGALLRQALLLTGEPERAERATRQALAGTARRWGRLAGPDAAEEHARRLLAAAAARRSATATPPAPAGDADRELVWRGLASLPPRRRVVLVLHADEGLDDPAIGARLGLPADAVRAEREAGMAALRSILLRRGRPDELLPAALAGVGADLPAPPPARRRLARRLVLAGGVAVVLAVAAALLMLALDGAGGGMEADPLPASAPPAGGLAWPGRGPLAGDQALLRAALTVWRDAAPAAQRPVDPAVLYAGSPDGARVVLLQGADAAGLGWAAEVADSGGGLALRRLEPLGRAVPLVALSAPGAGSASGTGGTGSNSGTGSSGAVRVLAPPDTGALLVRDAGLAPGAPLRRLALDADGLSEPLDPGAAGVPVVAVRGGAKPAVAGSGLVAAGRLSALTGTVEVAAGALPLAGSADVRGVWYDDGALLATKLGGPVVLAAAGPVLATTVRTAYSAARSRRLEARTYEVRRAGTRFLGTVFRLDGAPACLEATSLGPVGGPPALPVIARRCVPAGARDGALHVVAGERVAEVRLGLPVGGRGPRSATVRRPAGQPAGTGFAALLEVGGLGARGGSGAAYDGAGRVVAQVILGPGHGPRG
jgi:DNA-directed RNA polymerase specialized sigma24 family protein